VPQGAGAWTKSQVEATGDEVLPPVKAEVAGSSPVRTASIAACHRHNDRSAVESAHHEHTGMTSSKQGPPSGTYGPIRLKFSRGVVGGNALAHTPDLMW
jgi:hypothetical protein